MATIRFAIRKNTQEWDKIKKIFQKRNKGIIKNIQGDGCSQFITSELNKILKDMPSGKCPDTEIKHIQKSFRFVSTEENIEKLICISSNLGITPGTLIAKLTLDPHLLEK